MIEIIFMIFIWFVMGSGSFIFWWTKDHDLGVVELLLSILCGFLGPFSFLIGWMIHGRGGEKVILIKKRAGEGKIFQKMKGWLKAPKDDSEL